MIAPVSVRPAAATNRRWESWALLGILVLAALLYCWSLGDRALQPYYAAGVRSMTESGRAFLFGGFDPAGVVTVDKTPLAFWVQGVGVWIFGYHWWAIAAVQAVEGVAAVFVLHRVVRRWAGEHPALLAALILAVSPITTAINRGNQADALMVLLLLLAAYCVTRSVERAADGAGAGWLLWAGALVGLAFFAKMLAAWVVLPALAAAALAAPVSWPKRVLRTLAAGLLTAVVSLAWPVFVSLWPATDRPFVGSTTDDSIWQLLFGYNGFGRVAGGNVGSLGSLGSAFGVQFSGRPGPLRLLGAALGSQVGWLVPVAAGTLVGAVVVWARTRGGTPHQRAGWLLWGGWLVVAGLVFSFAGGIFHRYYTVELVPAVAALVAVGLTACWRWYRAGRAAGLLLPLAVAVTVGYAYVVLDRSPSWQPWLRTVILVVGLVCVAALLVGAPGRTPRPGSATAAVAGLAVVAMLAGPLAFSVDTALTPTTVLDAADPSAGPVSTDIASTARSALGSAAAAEVYLRYMAAAATLTPGQREVLDYVVAHTPNTRVQLAVELGSWGADPYLVNSSARVVAFGGYVGLDPSPTVAQLANWARTGQLGYVLLPEPLLEIGRLAAADRSPQSTGVSVRTLADRITWVSHECAPVPPGRIGPAAASVGVLFDCHR